MSVWIAAAGLALIVAIGATLLLRKRRECPACSRKISARAQRCPKCGADVAALDAKSSRSELKGRGKGW